MITFWIIAAGLIAAALAILLPPLIRPQTMSGGDRTAANVELYQQRLRELEADKSAGLIDDASFAASKQELDRNLLADTESRDQPIVSKPGRAPVLAAAILIPVLSVALYLTTGRIDVLSTPNPGTATNPDMHAIEQMVNKLATRLQSNPDDSEGWVMLGRSYTALNRYNDAERAYARAYTLIGDHPDFLADYAEIMAMNANNQLQGPPTRLLQLALKKDPRHIKALWLSGHAEVQLGNNKKAVEYWKKLLKVLPSNDEAVATVQQYIAQVEGTATTPAPVSAQTRISVTVRLASTLSSKAKPDDTVFIFARAASGPRMPLAIVRKQVRDLPVTVVLDDSMAMTPTMTLSSFDQVVIGARISRTGNALAQSGDLEGVSGTLQTKTAKPLTVTIDSTVK